MSWKQNKVVGVVAGIVLVIAVVIIVLALQPKKEEITLMSESTGEVLKMKVPFGADYPLLNPKTGKKDLYPAIKYKCDKGHIFYVIMKAEKGKPAIPKCPKCGSMNVQPVDTR